MMGSPLNLLAASVSIVHGGLALWGAGPDLQGQHGPDRRRHHRVMRRVLARACMCAGERLLARGCSCVRASACDLQRGEGRHLRVLRWEADTVGGAVAGGGGVEEVCPRVERQAGRHRLQEADQVARVERYKELTEEALTSVNRFAGPCGGRLAHRPEQARERPAPPPWVYAMVGGGEGGGGERGAGGGGGTE